MKFVQTSLLFFTLSLVSAHAACAAVPRAAIFDFSFDDTSLQGEMSGPRADEQARLAHLNAQLRTLLAQSGRYQPVNMAPVEAEERRSNLQACGGCELAMAQKIGADVAVTGLVQKVSNLILNINVAIRDVATGRVLQAQSVDIRGNTDETWSRGLNFLIAELRRSSEAQAPR